MYLEGQDVRLLVAHNRQSASCAQLIIPVVSHHWCSEEIWVSPIPKELLEQHLELIRCVLVSWKVWYLIRLKVLWDKDNQPPPFWWTLPALWGPWRKSIAAREKTCIRIILGRFFEDVEYSIDIITNQHKGIASPCTNYSVSSQHTDLSESGGYNSRRIWILPRAKDSNWKLNSGVRVEKFGTLDLTSPGDFI